LGPENGGPEYGCIVSVTIAYARPLSLAAALEALDPAAAPLPVVLAGGTDYFPARVGKPPDQNLLDITAIPEMQGITEEDDAWRIGATTRWSDIISADLPPFFQGLKQAAREIGGIQIQNAGTIAGNLCNASPAADGAAMLMAMNAEVELASRSGSRQLALGDFLLGNRQTALKSGELLTAIRLPKPRHAARSLFLKHGARRYLVISIVMAGILLETEGDKVVAARISIGACSPVALRLKALEADLIGRPVSAALARRVTPAHLEILKPIDDVRSDAAHRQLAALALLQRGLREIAKAPKMEARG